MDYARAVVAGILGASLVVTLLSGSAPPSEQETKIALLLLGVIAILVLPDIIERVRGTRHREGDDG